MKDAWPGLLADPVLAITVKGTVVLWSSWGELKLASKSGSCNGHQRSIAQIGTGTGQGGVELPEESHIGGLRGYCTNNFELLKGLRLKEKLVIVICTGWRVCLYYKAEKRQMRLVSELFISSWFANKWVWQRCTFGAHANKNGYISQINSNYLHDARRLTFYIKMYNFAGLHQEKIK